MRVEIVFFHGDHHLEIEDAMRIEIDLCNCDHYLKKGDIMRVNFFWNGEHH